MPGDRGDGELLKRIHRSDSEFRMPREGEPLPEEDREIIATWISEGAYWPGQMNATLEKETTTLWSMQPVVKPQVPDSREKPYRCVSGGSLEATRTGLENRSERGTREEYSWQGKTSFDYDWGHVRKPDGSIIKP